MDKRLLLFTDKTCDSNASRYNLTTPWRQDSWWYATDGRAIVRVPVQPDDPPEAKINSKRPSPGDIFGDWKTIDPNTAPSWPTIPPAGTDTTDCQRCLGMGQQLQECPTCEGYGDHPCECPECQREHKCGNCEGKGQLPISNTVCDVCEGDRVIPKSFDIGGVCISGIYWRLIRQLGVVHYAPAFTVVHYAPAFTIEDSLFFVADSGLQGAVMGLRKD